MIDLECMKKKLSKKNIDAYVESYLEISGQLEDLEQEWIDSNVEDEEFNDVLDMYDFLTEGITKHFIENYYKGINR